MQGWEHWRRGLRWQRDGSYSDRELFVLGDRVRDWPQRVSNCGLSLWQGHEIVSRKSRDEVLNIHFLERASMCVRLCSNNKYKYKYGPMN